MLLVVLTPKCQNNFFGFQSISTPHPFSSNFEHLRRIEFFGNFITSSKLVPSDCPFLDTRDTCEETNEDEQDLEDLFEDVKIREMMAKCLSEGV
jgi:hypothetical protein